MAGVRRGGASVAAGLLLLPLLLGIMPSAFGAHPWRVEVIDSAPTILTGEETSLAMDALGIPHVAYVLQQTNEFKYAVRGPSGWNVEVARPQQGGGWLSLKLDHSGQPHVAINNGTSRGLEHAVKSGGVWRFDVVDPSQPGWMCGSYLSLAFDPLDRPRIAYICETINPPVERRLRYASWNGTGWAVERVDSDALDSSLALGPDGTPHISYFNVSALQLTHAYYDGVRWNFDTVDRAVNLSQRGTSVVVDPLNRVHIAYFDVDGGLLKYARSNGVGWSVDTVDRNFIKGCESRNDVSLALDPSGQPGIAYFACKPGVQGNLGYAWNSTVWSTELVFTEYGSGGWPSLAFDARGNPHISFLYYWVGQVMYATVPPTLPDYVPENARPPGPIILAPSTAVTLSVNVTNLGAPWNVSSTLAFYNASTPLTPFARFPIPPLWELETAGPYAVIWTAPPTLGTYAVVASVDYDNVVPELNETNNLYTWTISVVPGPITTFVVGQPNVTLTMPYVTSSTPLSFSVEDRSGLGIRNTTYRVDGGPCTNYTATGPFTLSSEGEHLVEWFSEDFAGNVESIQSSSLRMDETPPVTTATVGTPRHQGTNVFVTSATPVSLAAADGGLTPVGLARTEYRVDGGPWSTYTSAFTLPGNDGPRTLGYRSIDLLGSLEADQTLTLILDDTPPTTDIASGTGPFTTETRFSLTATDSGCGVARTEYRVDGGPWIPYASPLALPAGDHVIGYRSVDHLNNTEAERTLSVTVAGTTELHVELNWKPFVALVFSIALVLAGAWSSRRVPWGGKAGRRRTVKAFALTSLPFVLAESATGIVSLFTGLLAIPPVLGLGTAVDVAILLAGLLVAFLRVTRAAPARPPAKA